MARAGFSTAKDAEKSALQLVLGVYRFIFKILFIPKVFIGFFLVCLHIGKPPLPEIDFLKAQQAAGEQRTNKKAKKLGMKPKENQNALN